MATRSKAVSETTPEPKRMEIFHALVEVQDTGDMSVPQSRKHIADRFGVTENHIREIEREGLEHEWPPL